jgi:hypothetical protein
MSGTAKFEVPVVSVKRGEEVSYCHRRFQTGYMTFEKVAGLLLQVELE